MNSRELAAKERPDQAKKAYQNLVVIKSQTGSDYRLAHGLAPAYLPNFDYGKRYKRTTAIVSSGNPDTTTHVSTIVPGIGTNMHGNFGYYMKFNGRLRIQAAHAGVDPRNITTISYLGYVAPKNSGLNLVQAASISYTDRTAPRLARSEEELRANAGARGHQFTNTFFGHSYSSATFDRSVPMMAAGTIDNFVMFSSPGSGVHSIDAYGLPESHIYELSTLYSDAVQELGPDASYGTDPRKLEGITHLSDDATGSSNYAVATGALSFDNHVSYFDEGTQTSQDFANIVTGGKQTTNEEWKALQTAQEKATELDRNPWIRRHMEPSEAKTPPPTTPDVMPGDLLARHS